MSGAAVRRWVRWPGWVVRALRKCVVTDEASAASNPQNLDDGPGDVVYGIVGGMQYPLTAWAREADIHHVTLAKRLGAIGAEPCGRKGRWDLYRGRDVFKALFQAQAEEPDLLPAVERKAWYDGELRKRDLQVRDGELVPSDDVRAAMARLARVMIDALVTLPDVLENECGLTAEDAERVEALLDRVRGEIATDLGGGAE